MPWRMKAPAGMALAGLLALACSGQAIGAPDRCRPTTWPPKARSVVVLKEGELRLLSQTIYAEARGEPDAFCSMAAVAFVVVNRMRDPQQRFGRGLKGVVHQPAQFSVWNGSRAKLLAVGPADPSYILAQLAAAAVLTGTIADPTAGATHFVNTSIPAPPWARRMTLAAVIGRHHFFKADN
jgi:spore germination cell wall hydrolase CwlJ-like protein